MGDVWRALSLQIGEQQQTVGSGRDLGRSPGKLFVRPSQFRSHQFGGHGDIHRAQQGQPLIGGIAKGGNFSFGIHHWFARTGIDGSTGPKACGDHAGASITRSYGPHHVVSSPCADPYLGAQTQLLGS